MSENQRSKNDPDRYSGEMDEIIEVPIEDVLDLHTFNPREVKELLDAYFHEASEQGFESVRVIHGKGSGTLCRITRSVCDRHPCVLGWENADAGRGGWGATIVYLKKLGQSIGGRDVS